MKQHLWIAVLVLASFAVAACGPDMSGRTPPSPAPAPKPASPPRTDKEDIAPEAATGFRVLEGVRGTRHMVSAANPHAARAGMRMLDAGGNALDAAAAMALVLTLVEPQSSGIGGGAFLLHWRADKAELSAYDGRETAPAGAKPDMFLARGKPRAFFDAVIGGLSVGVPGELRMLELAHREHGKLPWKELFAPAIELAEQGFAMSPRLYALLSYDRYLPRMAPARDYFYLPGGKPKPVGTVLKNPELAALLRRVADEGADAFYRGPIAEDIARTVRGYQANPGTLTAADMAAYRAKKRDPLCLAYRRYQLCGMPPPTSGGIAVLQIAGLLERFPIGELDPLSLELAHLFAEASRLAYADRDRYIADPDFVEVPVKALLEPSYLARRSQLIDPEKSLGKASAGELASADHRFAPGRSRELPSTSHLIAVDADGNAVSMTASIESAFGSHLMVHGFLLNNELTDFSFVPEEGGRPVANRAEPHKRPRSSMAPIVVLDQSGKRFVLANGSPGGSRIIDYVARSTLGVLDARLDPQSAIRLPHIVNRNGSTELEKRDDGGWPTAVKLGLERLGHEVELRELNSGLHAILRLPDGSLVGGADPRREGLVLAQ